MKNKFESFVSLVIIGRTGLENFEKRISSLAELFDETFRHWELVFVDNGCPKDMLTSVEKLGCRTTIVKLPRKHKTNQALQAGLDCAVGDYIYEFEDFSTEMDWKVLVDMYTRCQEGYDFVFCHPKRTKVISDLFYRSVKRYYRVNGESSDACASSVCVLSSRRGQNHVERLSKRIVNRNLSYMFSGLRTSYVVCDCDYRNRRGFFQNVSLLVDSYMFYTGIIVRMLTVVAVLFLMISLAMGVFAVVSYLTEEVIEGWTSMMLYISIGFTGIFGIMALISRYMDHILKTAIDHREYVYTDIIKKQEVR